jgi:glutathione S-transferase
MIIVHHLENSRSQRVLWLLEELGLPYEVRRHARARTMAAPVELKQVHPLGKAPIIEDDGIVIAETGAILEYLVEKAGGRLGAPTARAEALRYRYFLHYAEGSVMPALLMLLVLERVPVFGRAVARRLAPMLAAHLDYIEAELATRPWVAGAGFTAADVMMSFPIEFAAARAGGLKGRPSTTAWLAAVQARPGYRAALKAGGPYAFA